MQATLYAPSCTPKILLEPITLDQDTGYHVQASLRQVALTQYMQRARGNGFDSETPRFAVPPDKRSPQKRRQCYYYSSKDYTCASLGVDKASSSVRCLQLYVIGSLGRGLPLVKRDKR